MADMMTFPDTVEEFMEEYKLVDTEQVYTNGMELVPIFRMEQWFEHEKAQLPQEGTTSDLISRTETIEKIQVGITATNSSDAYSLGMRNGMRWCKSLIDGVEPKFEYGATRVDDGTDSADLPSAQPEPKEGEWIIEKDKHGVTRGRCPKCGMVQYAGYTNFCPNCGAKMKGEKHEGN